MQWKFLSSDTKIWSWCSWAPSIKARNDFAFSTGSFLITKSLNIERSSEKRLCSTEDLFSVVRVIFSIYTKYTNVFFILQEGFEVLKLQYFKLQCQRHIQNLLKHLRWSFLLKSVKSFRNKLFLIFGFWISSWLLPLILICTTVGKLH